MKQDVHPKWHSNSQVTCSCGNAFTVGATVPELSVEVCSACHPFYTGKMRYIDAKGRVQKFQDKMKKATDIKTKAGKKEKKEEKKEERPESFKEMLKKMR